MVDITNTAKQPRSLLDGMPGAIEAQEAAGQRELVASEVLPVEMTDETRQALEAAGVVFGDVVEGDELFRHAELPAGWSRRPTEHAMWSELVDETGAVRASIFYKAAFYDRRAHVHING